MTIYSKPEWTIVALIYKLDSIQVYNLFLNSTSITLKKTTTLYFPNT